MIASGEKIIRVCGDVCNETFEPVVLVSIGDKSYEIDPAGAYELGETIMRITMIVGQELRYAIGLAGQDGVDKLTPKDPGHKEILICLNRLKKHRITLPDEITPVYKQTDGAPMIQISLFEEPIVLGLDQSIGFGKGLIEAGAESTADSYVLTYFKNILKLEGEGLEQAISEYLKHVKATRLEQVFKQ